MIEIPAITKDLELDASLERVWSAITDPAQLGSWFPNRVEIESMSPGNRGWFVWDDHGMYITVVAAPVDHEFVGASVSA